MSKTNTTSSPVELPNAGNRPTSPRRLEGGSKGEVAISEDDLLAVVSDPILRRLANLQPEAFRDEATRLICKGIDTFLQNEVIKANLAINEYDEHYFAELFFDVGGRQVTPDSMRLRFRYELDSWPQPEILFEVGMSIIRGRATVVVCAGGQVAFDEVTVRHGPGEPW